MEYTNKQVEEIIKENEKLKEQDNEYINTLNEEMSNLKSEVIDWKGIADERQDEINELKKEHEEDEEICIENWTELKRLEKTIKEYKKEINHLKEMFKLAGDKNKTFKAVIKKYKEDNEEYNESVGIINVMVKEYDDIKLNRNRIVTKYQKQNNKLKESLTDIETQKTSLLTERCIMRNKYEKKQREAKKLKSIKRIADRINNDNNSGDLDSLIDFFNDVYDIV
jgi:chromosome segregation ATPase